MINTCEHYTPFNDIISDMVTQFDKILSPFIEFNKKRRIKDSANLFVNLMIDECIENDMDKFITEDLLKKMPQGSWNIETIDLENNLKSLFKKDFFEKLNGQFASENLKEKKQFIKQVSSILITTQLKQFKFLRKQISRASIREKDLLNIRFGRELIQTIDVINQASTDILLALKNQNVLSKNFHGKMKRYWQGHLLLLLRIIDVSKTKDKKIMKQKIEYLSVERVRTKNYF